MAARSRLPLCFHKNTILFRNQKLVHTEAGVKEPAYPPVIPSRTAKSKSALRRRVQEQIDRIKAASTEEKLRLITRVQREKFVVYPQTFARNADKWYQHFTKAAYIPGLPEKFSPTGGQVAVAAEDQENSLSAGIEDDAFADIRSLVTRVILNERAYTKKPRVFLYRKQEQVVGPFLRNLVSVLTYSLAKHNPLLSFSSLGKEF